MRSTIAGGAQAPTAKEQSRRKRFTVVALLVAALVVPLGVTTAAPASAVPVCTVPGDHTTIQAAIDDPDCDSIQVSAGTYAENLVLDRDVPITGAGSGSTDDTNTIIDASGGAVGIDVQQGGASPASPLVVSGLRVTGATQAGIADGTGVANVTLREVTSTANGFYGLFLNSGATSSDWVLEDVDLTAHEASLAAGLWVWDDTSLVGLTVDGGNIVDNRIGVYFECGFAATCEGTEVSDVRMTGVTISNNEAKGLYAEKLSDAVFDGVTVDNNGNSATLPAFAGAGFELNLKFQDYAGITVQNSVISNNGSAPGPQSANGAGIWIKPRDDGSTYGANPATLADVQVLSTVFEGNNTALRFGEVGKVNAGPTDAVVAQSCFSGSTSADVANVTSVPTDGRANFWGQSSGPEDGQVVGDVDVDPFLAECPPITHSDVTSDNPFFEEISWMSDNGITTGFADGTYRPSIDVSRQAMAAFMYRLAGEPAFTPPADPTFADVSSTNAFFLEIEWMADAGISTGFSGSPKPAFRPSIAVSRQAMAAFMYRLAGEPAFAAPAEPTFSDVSTGNRFYDEIEWMAEEGISVGFSGSPKPAFRPSIAVSRQAMAAFMYRLAPLLAG